MQFIFEFNYLCTTKLFITKMKFLRLKNLLFILLFVCFVNTLQAKSNISFSDLSSIENFIRESEKSESDTLLMKKQLEKLNGINGHRAEIVKMVLMAKAYDKSIDHINEPADSLYREAVRIAINQEDMTMNIWARMSFVENRYFFRDYEQLIPILLTVMNDLQVHPTSKVLMPAETFKLIGWVLQTMNDADESLKYLNKAIQFSKKDTEEYASLLYSIGLHYYRINEIAEAERYFDKTGKMALKIKDNSRYAKVLGSRAEILEAKGDIPAAIQLAADDVRYSRVSTDEQNLLYSLLLLSRLYLKNDQNAEAELTLAEAEKIAYSRSYYLSARRRVVLMKLEILDGQDAVKELSLLKELKILEDSVNKADGERAVRNSQYQIQKRKYEFELAKTHDAYRKKVNFYIIISSILLLVASFIYWSYRNKLRKRSQDYDRLVNDMEAEKQKYELKLSETESNLSSQIEYLKNKNAQIRKLNFEIQKLERSSGDNLEKKEGRLNSLLETHLMTEENWKMFKLEFQKTYPEYYENLHYKYPDLTDSNLRIILLLNLGFSYSETASLLGITAEAVRKSKQRMKKKYGESNDDLFETLVKFDEEID